MIRRGRTTCSRQPSRLPWVGLVVVTVWLGGGTIHAQTIDIPGVPEFQSFHHAVSNLQAGLDMGDLNILDDVLPNLHLLDQEMGPKLIRIAQRIMAAGVDVIAPGQTHLELGETPFLVWSANRQRTISLITAQGWALTSDSSLLALAQSNLQTSVALDVQMAAAVTNEQAKLAGVTIPAYLYAFIETDPEIPMSATAALTIRIVNVGDHVAQNAVLKIEKARNIGGGREEVVLGDLAAGEEVIHIAYVRSPTNGDESTYVTVTVDADNTDELSNYQVIAISDDLP